MKRKLAVSVTLLLIALSMGLSSCYVGYYGPRPYGRGYYYRGGGGGYHHHHHHHGYGGGGYYRR